MAICLSKSRVSRPVKSDRPLFGLNQLDADHFYSSVISRGNSSLCPKMMGSEAYMWPSCGLKRALVGPVHYQVAHKKTERLAVREASRLRLELSLVFF